MKNIKQFIWELLFQDKINEISQLNLKLSDLNILYSNQVQSTNLEKTTLKSKILSLNGEIEVLQKKILSIIPKVPIGAKVVKTAYKGDILIYTAKGPIVHKFNKLQHYFDTSRLLLDEIIIPHLLPQLLNYKAKSPLASEEDIDFFKWKSSLVWVQSNIVYKADMEQYNKIENWENPVNIFITRLADCESQSMLVNAISDAWRVSPNRLFMQTGKLNKGKDTFGHAWSMFIKDNGLVMYGDATTKKLPFSSKSYDGKKYDPCYGFGNKIFELRWNS